MPAQEIPAADISIIRAGRVKFIQHSSCMMSADLVKVVAFLDGTVIMNITCSFRDILREIGRTNGLRT